MCLLPTQVVPEAPSIGRPRSEGFGALLNVESYQPRAVFLNFCRDSSVHEEIPLSYVLGNNYGRS